MSLTGRQVCDEPLLNLYKDEIRSIFNESIKVAKQVAAHHQTEYGYGMLVYNKTAYNPYLIAALTDVSPVALPSYTTIWTYFSEADFRTDLEVPEHLVPIVKQLAERVQELDKEIPQVKQYFVNAFNKSRNPYVIKRLLCDAAYNLITEHYFESPGDARRGEDYPEHEVLFFRDFNRPYEYLVRNRILRNMLINPV